MNRSLLLLLVLLTVATPVAAKDGDSGGGGGGGGHGSDDGGGHDSGDDNGDDSDDRGDDGSRARSGVSSGAILPLEAILGSLENRYDARMIDADLDERRGRMVYDLELLTRDGRVLEIRVDAATARVLSFEVDD
jgi:hypothetical protein